MESWRAHAGTALTVSVCLIPSLSAAAEVMPDTTTLICNFCEPSGGFDKGSHTKEHTLLSVRKISDEKEENEENEVLDTISALKVEVNDRINALHDRVGTEFRAIGEKVDTELRAMRDNLSRILQLLERNVVLRSE